LHHWREGGSNAKFRMMRKGGSQAVDRALAIYKALLADQGHSSLAQISRALSLPVSTGYRLAEALAHAGLVCPTGQGRFAPGPTSIALAPLATIRPALVGLGRPVIDRLARSTGHIAQLGILEQDMVTYLIKAGTRADAVFTQEGKQLEAYCSGIGKVLLAALPAAERAAYLASGPFVALTPHTVIEPKALAADLEAVQAQGYAEDIEAVALNLFCLAVGVRDGRGRTIAALSVSASNPFTNRARLLAHLRRAAAAIEAAIARTGLCSDLEPGEGLKP
jgi:IclR family transcriptional regulator, acetate operon repressor